MPGALVGGAACAACRSAARSACRSAARSACRSAARSACREGDQEQAIAELQARQQPPAALPSAPPVPGGAPTITDRPARLGELVQQGLLTPEEFAATEAELLGA
ncbi:SHOCT domain-containing protein [Streptomyces sp. NPDC004284]|uniref:SHOCT domain-containing protein n=1 Tax=Streptomyces sp. NPDC004284 TaxID=3364695 RepID=UPI00369CE92C